MTTFERGDSLLRVLVDGSLYNEAVVFKCFYWYASQYHVDIANQPGGVFVIELRPRTTKWTDIEAHVLEGRVRQDLIDFKTRDIVNAETRTIRELLIAKAFAASDDFDDPPPGEIADPVGFTPSDASRE